MLRLIVDWVGRKFSRPPETIEVTGNAVVAADDAEVRVEVGHEAPATALQVLDQVIPVELMTASGRPIESIRDVPKGADGGIDVVIRIVTDTEHGARVIAGKIRRMIVQQAY